ncbi:MAG: glutamate racemase [Phycisphaerae bacterium]|mgnify:CR=1 FL=1|jgi:glutamate racemase|nr:MAG: glutamate racemase [Phycisphaerae bacterium]
MDARNNPILVIDSGLGGLTVVRALLNRLPGERIIYFGDTARLPYGTKTPETIQHYIHQIVQWGLRHQPKHVVLACNTASALALPVMRGRFSPIPITGVVEPGARAAAGATNIPEPVIGVIATEATIRSGAYARAIHGRRHRAKLILTSTPLLVPMIEEGRSSDDPLVQLALKQYLKSMIDHKIDVLVLGCTHYPLLKKAIRTVVGPQVSIIDSAYQCAEDVAARLSRANLWASLRSGDDRNRFLAYVTDDPDRFAKLAPRFLGFVVDSPLRVAPEVLYQQEIRPAMCQPA